MCECQGRSCGELRGAHEFRRADEPRRACSEQVMMNKRRSCGEQKPFATLGRGAPQELFVLGLSLPGCRFQP